MRKAFTHTVTLMAVMIAGNATCWHNVPDDGLKYTAEVLEPEQPQEEA